MQGVTDDRFCVFYCDACDHFATTPWSDAGMGARQASPPAGWSAVELRGRWARLCPACVKAINDRAVV